MLEAELEDARIKAAGWSTAHYWTARVRTLELAIAEARMRLAEDHDPTSFSRRGGAGGHAAGGGGNPTLPSLTTHWATTTPTRLDPRKEIAWIDDAVGKHRNQ